MIPKKRGNSWPEFSLVKNARELRELVSLRNTGHWPGAWISPDLDSYYPPVNLGDRDALIGRGI